MEKNMKPSSSTTHPTMCSNAVRGSMWWVAGMEKKSRFGSMENRWRPGLSAVKFADAMPRFASVPAAIGVKRIAYSTLILQCRPFMGGPSAKKRSKSVIVSRHWCSHRETKCSPAGRSAKSRAQQSQISVGMVTMGALSTLAPG